MTSRGEKGHGQGCGYRLVRQASRFLATVGAYFAQTTLPLAAAENGSGSRLGRVLLLQDYNTRVVMLGTLLLGVAAGVVGVFTLLRRRSLVGDVVGHASLPGIGIAFLVLERLSPGSGRSLPGLLTGAFLAGMIGVASVTFLRRWTRIKEDAALAIVLSLFFGIGIVLFTIIQNLPGGNAAGLHQFIFGKAASLVASDVWVIAVAALGTLAICLGFFKEFRLLAFDEDFARTQGWPTTALDLLMMALVGAVTVIGLQSVGLLLVVALLIIPPVTARFWTHRLSALTALSAAIGGTSSMLGVAISSLFPRLAAGAVIVLTGTSFFVVSLLFGTKGGWFRQLLLEQQMRRRIGRLDLLRACFEAIEARSDGPPVVISEQRGTESRDVAEISWDELKQQRQWPGRTLGRLVRRATADGLFQPSPEGLRLTPRGFAEAARVTRNHRLWETYLIAYADVAPSHVDRNADSIEHALDAETVRELERLTAARLGDDAVPPSPHGRRNAPETLHR